jgi:chemotaxis methyl-accepting protein methylase
MSDYLSKITSVMQNIHNLDLSVYEKDFLSKAVVRRMTETEHFDHLEYLALLEYSFEEANKLSSALYITYSQFFRDSTTFAILEQSVLSSIIASNSENHEIRIWSAGCSTGQEAYSIAILMSELSVLRGKNLRYRIFATDISEEALIIAREGKYSHNAVLNLKLVQIEKYFDKHGDRYNIKETLKSHIDFIQYDLLDMRTLNPPDSIYGDFDLILCCNLLIYFNSQSQQKIIEKLKKTLVQNGYLVVGDVEKSIFLGDKSFCSLDVNSAIYQKNRRRMST